MNEEPDFLSTELDYLDARDRAAWQDLRAAMRTIWQQEPGLEPDDLLRRAMKQFNTLDHQMFDFCEYCGEPFHSDYSSNSDPDRCFCKSECEWHWLLENPDEPYNGELLDEEE